MCGITGFFAPGGIDTNDRVCRMANTIDHRGPDDSGLWIDQNCGLAFGHRRLAVLDLSRAGHQPMVSTNGRYVVIYNGEIYNHLELRAELGRNGNGALAEFAATQTWRG